MMREQVEKSLFDPVKRVEIKKAETWYSDEKH